VAERAKAVGVESAPPEDPFLETRPFLVREGEERFHVRLGLGVSLGRVLGRRLAPERSGQGTELAPALLDCALEAIQGLSGFRVGGRHGAWSATAWLAAAACGSFSSER
jgi:hypothetical protein